MCLVAELVLLICNLTGMLIGLDAYVASLATGLRMEPHEINDPNCVEVAHCVPVLDELNITDS